MPGGYPVHTFSKHIRAQVDVGSSRNLPFRGAEERDAAIESAKHSLAKLRDFTTAFDACPNAGGREAFLEPFKTKAMTFKNAGEWGTGPGKSRLGRAGSGGSRAGVRSAASRAGGGYALRSNRQFGVVEP